VLYASSQRLGPFLETLARFRRDLAIDAEYALIEPDERDDAFPTLDGGLIPTDWREKRYIGTASHGGRFVDIGRSESLAHLRSALAARLLHYGLDDLDAGAIRRAPRPFTQELSRYVFETGYLTLTRLRRRRVNEAGAGDVLTDGYAAVSTTADALADALEGAGE
jgi:hypothetical protein